MQRITVRIPTAGFVGGEMFRLFGNMDGRGRALAAIDYTAAITGDAAQPFWPGLAAGVAPPAGTLYRLVISPRLYFGWYRFGVKAYDPVGNVSAGEPAEFSVCVNSGPQLPSGFRQTDVFEGRPVFAFSPPAQLR